MEKFIEQITAQYPKLWVCPKCGNEIPYHGETSALCGCGRMMRVKEYKNENK